MKFALSAYGFASAAILALGLAACGGGEPAPAEPAPVAEVTPAPAPEPVVAPVSTMGETPADVPAFMKDRHEKYEDLGKNFKVVLDNFKSATPDMAAVKLIDYDFATYGASETRERLLARWEADVKSKGGSFEE